MSRRCAATISAVVTTCRLRQASDVSTSESFTSRYGQQKVRPTKTRIALRLSEWDDMRAIVEAINGAHAALVTTLPCYIETDNLNQEAAFQCREYHAIHCVDAAEIGCAEASPDCDGGRG